MTNTSKETTLKRVPYIWYPVQFHRKNNKNKDKNVWALIDSDSKVNAMYHAYTTKLGFCVGKINVGAQKIDRSYLYIFGIVIADCLVNDKLRRVQFFQETFLLANIDLEVVLGVAFLIFTSGRHMVCRTWIYLEDLYGCRGLTNNQEGGNY